MRNDESALIVRDAAAEHTAPALGIGTPRPRLSWRVETETRGWLQSAYELKISGDAGSGRNLTYLVESSSSTLVPWPFESLRSREAVSLEIRVRGLDGAWSAWSDPLSIEAGLLSASDWQGRFISPDTDSGTTNDAPLPYLRREFPIDRDICSARLYISALGLYEAYINGCQAGDQLFTPGWTEYDSRLLYQTYDVTGLLKNGENVIGAVLADGWYRGRIGFDGGKRNIWGDRLGLLAQLEICYSDGSTELILSDGGWKSSTGGFLRSGLYDGEHFDRRLEPAGWRECQFDDSGWYAVSLLERDMSSLEAPTAPPVRRIEYLAPKSVFVSPSGKTLVDFGQNLVGRVRIRLNGSPGDTITVRHAEVLEDGELGTGPLRLARATDCFISSGNGIEEWEPTFTFHGFRYAEVCGWPGSLQSEDIQAVVVHSDMQRLGHFQCSDSLINRLHENIVWSMKGNFLGIPTDCPQRDERLGWTGDIQVFAPTAAYLYDVKGFLQSWLRDLILEQEKCSGVVPPIIPNALGDNFGAAGWGDAAVIVPWTLYERYGDVEILEDQFESMKSWVDYAASVAGEERIWNSGFQFGDWLDPTAPPQEPWKARTAKEIVATAYFAHSAELTSRAAEVIGRQKDASTYRSLAADIKVRFCSNYVSAVGRIMSDSETAYALALVFNLYETENQRQCGGKRLSELVMEGGYRIRTGFLGTPLICEALSMTGHYKTAYRLLFQKECPSWLYPVTMGGTTIWERWDSLLPDGSINPGEMTSFNHYALGSVGDWLHRHIGGIEPASPGYRKIRFAPRPGGGISWSRASYMTPFGLAACSWKIVDGRFEMAVEIPPGAAGEILLPGSTGVMTCESGYWTWSRNYTDPDARGPYTVEDTCGDILGEPGAAGIIVKVLNELNAPGYLKALAFSEPGVTLKQALSMLPETETAIRIMNDALRTL